MYGTDQAASVQKGGFFSLVGVVRKIQAAMGDGVIGIHEKEVPIAQKLRAHIPWESSEFDRKIRFKRSS
jgi:N-acetylneuraminate synthase